jgi:multidrug efflux pump subunit AcrA (membrane-fusion protein)
VSGPIMSMSTSTHRSGPDNCWRGFDPRPFAAQVALARTALANARAQLRKDQANLAYQKVIYERDRELIKTSVISQNPEVGLMTDRN